MPDLSTLRDLQRRLREATGPDRELDAAIFDAFGLVDEAHVRSWCRMDGLELTRAHYLSAWAHYFTTAEDIGKVIALIERELPESGLLLGKGRESPPEPLYAAIIFAGISGTTDRLAEEEHNANLALAACIALVSALIAIKEREAANG